MVWQTIFAGFSAFVASLAALFAWFAVKEARRQTDIAAGNIAPEFSVHRDEILDFQYTARFVVSVRNLNRKRISIETLLLECDPEFAISGIGEDPEIAIEKVLAERGGRNFSYSFNPPYCVEGHDPGLLPKRWSKNFRMVRRLDRTDDFTGTVEAVIGYRVDGNSEREMWRGSLTVSNVRSHR